MIDSILRFSIKNRQAVVLLALLLAAWGIYNLTQLPIDAVPDITNKQVQLNAVAPALGPEEVERKVTFPLEVALSGLPQVEVMRSISQFGLAQITAVFSDDTPIYFARQLVSERLLQVELPDGVRTEMAPVSTGLGEIYYVRLHNPNLSLMERRSLMDWVVRPQLRTVSGLADVNTWGGEVKQIHVLLDPRKLVQYGLGVRDVVLAVEANNANAGGSVVRRGTEQEVVRTLGLLEKPDDLRSIVIAENDSVPVFLGQLADVREGPLLRQGAMTKDGKGEEVYAIALLLLGENGRAAVQRVKDKIASVQESLPQGSTLEGFLDRSQLIDATLETASKNLAEGGILVVGLLFLFLLQLQAGLIVSAAIPLSMLVAVIGMRYFHISANLMSLGAIDFGLIVDGSVIIVENCVRRLAEEPGPVSEERRLELIGEASAEVRKATQFGEILILSTYLPILSLQGIEGKMFRPMGWTVILALTGAMVLSFTLIPALCAYFLKVQPEHAHPLLDRITPVYRQVIQRFLGWGWRPLIAGGLLVLLSMGVLGRLGTEFIPDLDEGAIAMQVNYPPSIRLEEVIAQSGQLERLVKETCPEEVTSVVTRIGRPEIATDPMLTSQTDVLIELKPGTDQKTVVQRLERAMAERPGIEFSFTQPIKMRMMELVEGVGVRADLGIKLFGSDPAVLASTAQEIAKLVETVPGAADVMVETTQGLPQLQIAIDRQRLARVGLNVSDVNEVVEAAIGGKTVTSINDGNQRIDVAVRLSEEARNNPDAIRRLPVKGDRVALEQVADLHSVVGPVQISRENGKRRIVVQANVRGRDLGGFVEEVQRRLKAELRLPVGYYLEYGGTYEKLRSGRERLAVVVPLTFLLVFGLLYWTFQSVSLAALVFTGIPFAASGGILALWLRGMPLSISAAIGFVALAGVAVLNGVVMLTFIEQLRSQGESLHRAVMQGAVLRLRPVLMTAAVASIGFLPMALSQGAGAEVQRPLATVVIGGLLTSTTLTLLLLPCLYYLVRRRR